MATWLDAIMSPLNAAGEGIQKLIEVRDLLKFGDALGKLQAQILSAQQGALAAYARETELIEEIRALKERVAQLDARNTQIERYELVALAPNVVAYSIKPAVRGSEPAHYICADCAANGKKFFLQQHIRGSYYDEYRCGGCGFKIGIDKGNPPQDWGTAEADFE